MSYNDEQFLKRLDDPLAKDIPLDHEITPTIVHIKPIADRKLPTTPLVYDENQIQRHNYNTINTHSRNTNTQTRRINRRLNYELLNQFLLYCELGHILHIQKFIKHPNIDIDFQNARGHTPVMVTIIHNQTSKNTAKLVQLLFDGGANGDITDYEGQTVFNYACDHNQEEVLYTLIRCGINTYHRLLPTLALIQDKGLLNILYTLITHFAVEKEFSARCGVCNHILKQETASKKTKCCIGEKWIRKNELYYVCGAEYGCWGEYVVCCACFEYGILKFMMDITRRKKYNSLNKKEKYEVDKHILRSNLQNPLNKKYKRKSKGIHFYSSYPNHYDENIHSPIANISNGNISPRQALLLIDNDININDENKAENKENAKESDSDSDDSDSDSDSNSNSNSDSEDDKSKKDPDEAPNFKEGNGRKFMSYILRKEEYWYGKTVLNEKEWREIYWMDINMQLKWLIMLRRKVFDGVVMCLLNDIDHSYLVNQEIVSQIMEMIMGTSKVDGCFLRNE